MSENFVSIHPIQMPHLPDNPLVSVLVANYNYGTWIGEAIESVLSQAYQNFELIICDDGSSDNSLEVIRRYASVDERITYVAKPNGGMASAWNVAYDKSRGDILCFLDADDAFFPEKLGKVVNAMKERPGCGLVLHKMQIFYGDKPGPIIPVFTRREQGYIAERLYRRGGRWRYMPASALCIRKEVAKKIFPIDEALFRSEADAFVFTLAPILTEVCFLEDVLSLYRLHGRNLTGSGGLDPASIKKTIATLERVMRGVNARLREWGFPEIDIQKNLNFLEQAAYAALVSGDGSRREVLSLLSRLTRLTMRDDLYTPFQKIAAIVAYWTALFMPKSVRPKYLYQFLYPTKFKDRLRLIKELVGVLSKRLDLR